MKTFSDEAISKTIHEVVAEYGEDYVYRSPEANSQCVYAVGGSPSCLVGHVIARLDPESFKAISESELNTRSVYSLVGEFGGFQVSDLAVSALAAAQTEQDLGFEWGQALAAFDREMGDVDADV